jgi:hypothetical protein
VQRSAEPQQTKNRVHPLRPESKVGQYLHAHHPAPAPQSQRSSSRLNPDHRPKTTHNARHSIPPTLPESPTQPINPAPFSLAPTLPASPTQSISLAPPRPRRTRPAPSRYHRGKAVRPALPVSVPLTLTLTLTIPIPRPIPRTPHLTLRSTNPRSRPVLRCAPRPPFLCPSADPLAFALANPGRSLNFRGPA